MEAFFGLPLAGVAGREGSFSLPLIDTRGGVGVSFVAGGEDFDGFSFDLCDVTPFLAGAGDSTRLGVEEDGVDEGPGVGAAGRSFFAGVARARISSSVGSTSFFRFPMTNLGIGRSLTLSAGMGGTGFSRSFSR